MEIKFRAAFDGKQYRMLTDSASSEKIKNIEEFEVTLKPSTIFSMAEADAIVTEKCPPQPNGMRSLRAEERLFPAAYVKIHATSIKKNGAEMMPLSFEGVSELGPQILAYVHNNAEAVDSDFLLVKPPPSSKDGEKDTDQSSKASTKS
jgi:hypothetical protein